MDSIYAVAPEIYLQALKLSPGNLKCFYRLGVLMTSLGRLTEAEAYLQAATHISPKNQQIKKALETLYGLRKARPAKRESPPAHVRAFLLKQCSLSA